MPKELRDGVQCPSCSTKYDRGRGGGLLKMEVPGQPKREVKGSDLVAQICDHGGPWSSARRPDGSIFYEARVSVRRTEEEEALRYKDRLIGYVERFGKSQEAVLRLTDDAMSLVDAGGEEIERWPLTQLRALQTSSSSVQISPPEGGMIQFKFLLDSPMRWEELLRTTVREAYLRIGLEVVEFQTRIRTR